MVPALRIRRCYSATIYVPVAGHAGGATVCVSKMADRWLSKVIMTHICKLTYNELRTETKLRVQRQEAFDIRIFNLYIFNLYKGINLKTSIY
jgi:hypothetical protein